MQRKQTHRRVILAMMAMACALLTLDAATAQLNNGRPQKVSTGQIITPLAQNGATFRALNPGLADDPNFTVGQAVTTTVSPDGKTLLILTSGFNSQAFTTGVNAGNVNAADSNEYVFVFDISTRVAVQKQVIQVHNTYSGLVFNPNGQQFYVSGGADDIVHVFTLVSSVWTESQVPVSLGHYATANPSKGSYGGLGLITKPMASGLGISQDGNTLVVANYENDSISVLTGTAGTWAKTGEFDLRPGKSDPTLTGVAGGEFPYWVSIVGNSTAYVSSIRDREIDVVNVAGTPALVTRIKVTGSPNRSVLSADQSMLYVSEDNSDTVAAINTANNSLVAEFNVSLPQQASSNPHDYRGANPNSVALSPDGKTLYVTDGGLNAVAVVQLSSVASNSQVIGLIPTGFYPNSVSVSADGKRLFIVNGKSGNGPNPDYCYQGVPNGGGTTPNCNATNGYDLQLTKAGFQTVKVPKPAELSLLTEQVFRNDHLNLQLAAENEEDAKIAELHKRIKHVIYIIKENRTYDQVLGDLPEGNGDPTLTQFGAAITPNLHKIANDFVDFDNFRTASEVSGDGWPWSTSARTTDTIEKEIPVNYAGRGGDNNSEGTNRNLNVGIGNYFARIGADPLTAANGVDPNVLPGTANMAAPDSADGGVGEGYIWNAAGAAGLTVRDYGMFVDIARYNLPAAFGSINIAEDPTPFADNLVVAHSTSPFLAPFTDPYFRGFDNSFPDYYRFQEWNREFQQFDANGNLPNLSLVRIMHDHTGNFDTAINGVNTPVLQVADNDYAVGLLVEAVANSKSYHDNTLIFIIEDDSQDGGDHVDAHRSTAYIVGPYVRHGKVDSRFYNTVSMLRTIEDILGTPHLNLNDANTHPMASAFDLNQKKWSFAAAPSGLLAATTLPIPASAFSSSALAEASNMKQLHGAAWWAKRTKGMDFSVEDRLDSNEYNRLLWTGIMGNKPYPTRRSGRDMSKNREELLKKSQQAPTAQSAPKLETQGGVAGSAR